MTPVSANLIFSGTNGSISRQTNVWWHQWLHLVPIQFLAAPMGANLIFLAPISCFVVSLAPIGVNLIIGRAKGSILRQFLSW